MLPFDRFKDLITITIAAVAVVLSLVTVIVQKRQQQRDAYRHIQDVPMSADLQRGRWMIIEISLGKLAIPQQFSPEFYLLNRTLGMYDTLAMYVRRRVVPPSMGPGHVASPAGRNAIGSRATRPPTPGNRSGVEAMARTVVAAGRGRSVHELVGLLRCSCGPARHHPRVAADGAANTRQRSSQPRLHEGRPGKTRR